MAKRLLPSMNRLLAEKLLQPKKGAAGILLPGTPKQVYRLTHSQSVPESEYVKRAELIAAKTEMLTMIKENEYQWNIKFKGVQHESQLISTRVENLWEKVTSSLEYHKTSLDNINSKNTLYVLGFITATASGIFSVVRICQLKDELFPDGLLPSMGAVGERGSTVEKPKGCSTVEKPKGGSTVEKPKGGSTVEKPKGGSTVEKP